MSACGCVPTNRSKKPRVRVVAYPKASSILSAAWWPIEGIQWEYRSRIMVMLTSTTGCWMTLGFTLRPKGKQERCGESLKLSCT
jgi:hypothetical protein